MRARAHACVVLLACHTALAHHKQQVGLLTVGGDDVAIPLAQPLLHVGDRLAVLGIKAGLQDVSIRSFYVNGVRVLEGCGNFFGLTLRHANRDEQQEEKKRCFGRFHGLTSQGQHSPYQARLSIDFADGGGGRGVYLQSQKSVRNRRTMRNNKQGAAAADAALEGENGFSLISNDTLIHLYANLLKCRLFDECVEGLVRQRKAAADHAAAAGCEAANVGVAMDLTDEDGLSSVDDGVLLGFLHGGSPAGVFRSLRAHGTPAMNLGAQLHTAMGAALAHKTKRNGKVVVVFWREGALRYWLDALEIARANGLPMIFVCVTSLTGAPESRTKRTNAANNVNEAPGSGLPNITVDGNDVVAVYRVAHESIGRARLGRGPTLIQCEGFRVKGQRKAHDSIANMENYLRGKGLFKREIKKQTVEDFTRELDAAMKLSRKKLRV